MTLQAVWNKRADEVQVAANNFVLLHNQAVGQTQGLYLHILHSHTADQIRMFGDLRKRSSQGLEHCHKWRKQDGLQSTNRRPGQRMEQQMTRIVVRSELTEQIESSEFKAKKQADSKDRLLKRAIAKCKRLQEVE